jgi:hypothetical protein
MSDALEIASQKSTEASAADRKRKAEAEAKISGNWVKAFTDPQPDPEPVRSRPRARDAVATAADAYTVAKGVQAVVNLANAQIIKTTPAKNPKFYEQKVDEELAARRRKADGDMSKWK